MTTTHTAATRRPYRAAGLAAVASGGFGVLAFALLIGAVTTRSTQALSPPVSFMFRAHDIGAVLQLLCLLPLVKLLSTDRQQHSKALVLGIGATWLTAIFLVLALLHVLADTLYMLPQGMLGLWLVVVSRARQALLSRSLRWFATAVGAGLILVGLFPVGYVLFVDPVILAVPAVDPANYPLHDTRANQMLHVMLDIGTLAGVVALPIWTIAAGAGLLRSRPLE